jgi:serine/threonine protein kinase
MARDDTPSTLSFSKARAKKPLPAKLGRYEILSELGVGSMGVVYKARDPNIGRYVALKTINFSIPLSEKEEAEFRARFFREAQAAGNLSHPNIIQIYDAGEDSVTGTAYIAMEFAAGANLRDFMEDEHLLPLEKILDVMKQLGRALAYAHGHGIIHRDIKPANLILTTTGELKITDFGIAKIPQSSLTSTGKMLGTPYYMAPELLLNKDFDHRSDFFGAGVVFYQMLTGHMPFSGASMAAVCYQIVHSEPTPIRNFRPQGVPPGIEEILARLLAKDPDDRYSTASELVAEIEKLEKILAAQAAAEGSASPRWNWRRSGAWIRQTAGAPSRAFWLAVMGVGLAGLLLQGLTLYLSFQARGEDAPAQGEDSVPLDAGILAAPPMPEPSGPAVSTPSAGAPSAAKSKPASSASKGTAPPSSKPAAKAMLTLSLEHPLDNGKITVLADDMPFLSQDFAAQSGVKRSEKSLWKASRPLSPGTHRFAVTVEGAQGRRKFLQSCQTAMDFKGGASYTLFLDARQPFMGKERLHCSLRESAP